MDAATGGATAIRFDPFDPELVRSPWATYARLRDEDPVHRHPDGFWVLSRFADVAEAARDTATFSSAQGLTFLGGDIELLGLAPTIVMMDPPVHTAFRRLVSRGFTPRKVADLEPSVRAFVNDRLDTLIARIDADGEADLIDGLAGPLPSFVVATYLGVPEEDRGHFDEWSHAIVAANAGGNILKDAQDAVGGLYEYFTALIEKRRAEPTDDMISALVHAEIDGDEVPLEAILGYAFVMIAGGNDTTTGLLGGAAELLTERPDQRQVLVDDPSLLANAVEELLRLTSPAQGLSRTTTRAVAVDGVEIPKGVKVHLLYGSANRDPREFGPTAGELDVTRRISKILTFTNGPHYCLGAAAARLQGRVALEELLRRLPTFTVDGARGRYAPGAFVRRFEHLPITAG